MRLPLTQGKCRGARPGNGQQPAKGFVGLSLILSKEYLSDISFLLFRLYATGK